MSTYVRARDEARLRVWITVAAIVAAVNVATGGEAITQRIAEARSLVEAARAAISIGEPEVVVETSTPRCSPKIRVRRVAAPGGTRVIIRRRWGCRA